MTAKQLCGVQKAVELIGSKWALLILHNLCNEHRRGFNELARAIEGISPRILSLRLKELADHGLVHKEVIPTTPPQTQYSITEKGMALRSIIDSLGKWADAL